MTQFPIQQRIFAGVYPCGIVYADRKREVAGDYKRLAFLDYATLTLNIESDCPPDLAGEIRKDAATIQARRGEQFKLSTCGQSITLGHGIKANPSREPLTCKLNGNGREVLAKIYMGEPYAVTYANRTQANRKQTELGDEWEVIHSGRPFYVARKRAESLANPSRAGV